MMNTLITMLAMAIWIALVGLITSHAENACD